MRAPDNIGGRRLFLDLDGVMADFDQHYADLFGSYSPDLPDDELWGNINAQGDFFATMPMCPGARVFFESIRHLDPVVCTACPKSNYAPVANQKRQWVRENLSPRLTVLPVMGGRNKALFMHQLGDVLIDDYERNLQVWREAGGMAVAHAPHDFEATMAVLWALSETHG